MNMVKPRLVSLPLTPGQLDSYRVRNLRRTRAAPIGGHLTRRRGQSLEFREYAPYVPGDDTRHIDWLVSARYQGENDLLVRRFQAEEQFTLVLSIDTRESMWLPDALPKLQVAFWLAEAIAWVALGDNDRAVIHDLFGQGAYSLQEIRGKAQRPRLRTALNRMAEQVDGASNRLNLGVLERVLNPAVLWVIITDLYFVDPEDTTFLGETSRELARAISRARDGLRWVILVDLDCWDHEQTLLEKGGFYIDGPGTYRGEIALEIDDESLALVKGNIADYKKNFAALSQLPGQDTSHWDWPDPGIDAEHFFTGRFGGDPVLARIFDRSP
jgi:hypothetical protein